MRAPEPVSLIEGVAENLISVQCDPRWYRVQQVTSVFSNHVGKKIARVFTIRGEAVGVEFCFCSLLCVTQTTPIVFSIGRRRRSCKSCESRKSCNYCKSCNIFCCISVA